MFANLEKNIDASSKNWYSKNAQAIQKQTGEITNPKTQSALYLSSQTKTPRPTSMVGTRLEDHEREEKRREGVGVRSKLSAFRSLQFC